MTLLSLSSMNMASSPFRIWSSSGTSSVDKSLAGGTGPGSPRDSQLLGSSVDRASSSTGAGSLAVLKAKYGLV